MLYRVLLHGRRVCPWNQGSILGLHSSVDHHSGSVHKVATHAPPVRSRIPVCNSEQSPVWWNDSSLTASLIAITNLDSAIYSVTYQMKILTTALFSVFLLHKHLSLRKWIALIIIVPGVGLVELSSKSATMKTDTTAQDPLLGFICIVICSLTSGFAGVFFEMVLKGKTKSNIWIQSIQLCLATCFFCCLNAMTKDLPRIREEGFFTGYNTYTWITIFLNVIIL